MGGGAPVAEAKENVAANPLEANNPASGDFDKLKALYNTPAPSAQPMGMGMGQQQPGAFATGMPMGGAPMGGAPMGGMGMGGMGMQQPMGGMPMGGMQQPMGMQ